MTDFDIENDIRVAGPDDFQEIFRICCLLHAEIARHPFNELKVRSIIWRGVNRDGAICAVIGRPDDIKAMLLMTIEEIYYSDESEIIERWNYVRPDCRKSTFAKQMIGFARRISRETGLIVGIGIDTNVKLEAKRRLYERSLKLGGYWFIIDPKDAETLEAEIGRAHV